MFRSLRTARAPIAAACRTPAACRTLPTIQSRLMATTTTTTTTTTDNTDAATPPPAASATSSVPPPSPVAETVAKIEKAGAAPGPGQKKVPYFVERNKLYNLSVYHREFRGGNLKKTIIKNASGDLKALKEDLAAALQISENDVSINTLTKHLMIKGHVKPKVLTFLSTMGF